MPRCAPIGPGGPAWPEEEFKGLYGPSPGRLLLNPPARVGIIKLHRPVPARPGPIHGDSHGPPRHG